MFFHLSLLLTGRPILTTQRANSEKGGGIGGGGVFPTPEMEIEATEFVSEVVCDLRGRLDAEKGQKLNRTIQLQSFRLGSIVVMVLDGGA